MGKTYIVGIVASAALVAAAVLWNQRASHPEPFEEASTLQPERGRERRSAASSARAQHPQLRLIGDSGLHWEERVEAVRDLPEDLDSATLDQLFGFLRENSGEEKEHWYLVANEIMEVLWKRNIAPDQYTAQLQALIASETIDPVIRDYAAQHLAQWISGVGGDSREMDPREIDSAFATMIEVAARPENGHLTLCGTTVNALTDAVINGSPAMQAKSPQVTELALKILSDSSAATFNRASAMAAAARLRSPGLAILCREFLGSDETPPDIQLGSIAALGFVGSDQDLALLESMRSTSPFKHAASAAIDRLSSGTN